MGTGGNTNLIGRATLEDHDLRLPDTGPPCKVIEHRLALVDSPPPSHGVNRGPSHATGTIATVVMFLERVAAGPDPVVAPSNDRVVPPAAPLSTPATENTTTTAGDQTRMINEDDGTTSNTRNTTKLVSSVPMSVGKEQPRPQSPSPPPPLPVSRHKQKVQVKVLQAWGLASGAKVLDAVVTFRACGRDVGTTRVSAVGGATSPEWIDEQ